MFRLWRFVMIYRLKQSGRCERVSVAGSAGSGPFPVQRMRWHHFRSGADANACTLSRNGSHVFRPDAHLGYSSSSFLSFFSFFFFPLLLLLLLFVYHLLFISFSLVCLVCAVTPAVMTSPRASPRRHPPPPAASAISGRAASTLTGSNTHSIHRHYRLHRIPQASPEHPLSIPKASSEHPPAPTAAESIRYTN